MLDAGMDIILGLFAPYNDNLGVEQKYGHRFTIDGGLNQQLLSSDDVTDEMIIAEIRRCIDQNAPYKNLIVNPGVITDPHQAALICNEIRTYGKDYWKRTR